MVSCRQNLTSEHLSISGISQLLLHQFWPNFKSRFLWGDAIYRGDRNGPFQYSDTLSIAAVFKVLPLPILTIPYCSSRLESKLNPAQTGNRIKINSSPKRKWNHEHVQKLYIWFVSCMSFLFGGQLSSDKLFLHFVFIFIVLFPVWARIKINSSPNRKWN